MSVVLFHKGHFVILRSYATSEKWGRTGITRIALIEIRDPDGKLPSRIDCRLKNYKRLILIEERLPPIESTAGRFVHANINKRYKHLALRFEQFWPMHMACKEWPLPREVYWEWPDHLKTSENS